MTLKMLVPVKRIVDYNVKVIVAINKDEEAPIFSVADLFTAVPELVKAL